MYQQKTELYSDLICKSAISEVTTDLWKGKGIQVRLNFTFALQEISLKH